MDEFTLEDAPRYGLQLRALPHATLTFESPVMAMGAMGGNVEIGYATYFRSGSIQWVSIGRFCSIANGLHCGTGEHPTGWFSTHPFQYEGGRKFPDDAQYRAISGTREWASYRPSRIGNDVWIGADVYISGGVTIGDGAIIAARAVVTRDVSPYTVVGGVPARTIRMRFPAEIVARLQALSWWNYDLSAIAAELPFDDPVATLVILERTLAAGTLPILAPPRYRIERPKRQPHRIVTLRPVEPDGD